jgi:uncharacterized membrane protein YhhN
MIGRGLFAAALIAGASYTIAAWAGWSGPALVAWKGAGVALLAGWAWRAADTRGGRQLALVLACGAAGDELLEAAGLVVGAIAFLIGHLVAIDLYRRHAESGAWRLIAGCTISVAAISAVLARDAGVGFYALALGAMAGAATASRLPCRLAIGAWLFVASDLLIFAELGPLQESAVPRLLIWPLYFAGQALIAHGGVTSLRRNENLHHRI